MFKSGYTPGSIAGLLQDGAQTDSTNNRVAQLFSSPQTPKPAKIREQKRKRKMAEKNERKTEDDTVYQKMKRKKLANIVKSKDRKAIISKDTGTSVKALPHDGNTSRADVERTEVSDDDNQQESKVHGDRKTMRLKAKQMKEKKKKTVFLGQLPTTVSKRTVRQLLHDCGKVESVRFRSAAPANPKMPKRGVIARKEFHPNVSTFNAYVVFETELAAKKAANCNGMMVDGHHVCVDYLGKAAKHDHKRSLFVGNLPFDAKEEDVREHFEECGEVTNVRLVRDKFTRIGKGFGYVLFEDKDSVDLALKFDGKKFKDRKLRVERSSDQSNKVEKGKKSKSDKLTTKRKTASLDSKESSPARKKRKETDQSFDNPSRKQLSASRLKEKKKKKLRHRLDKKKKQKIANILTGKPSEKLKKSTKDSGIKSAGKKRIKTAQEKQHSKLKKHSRDGSKKTSSNVKRSKMHRKKSS